MVTRDKAIAQNSRLRFSLFRDAESKEPIGGRAVEWKEVGGGGSLRLSESEAVEIPRQTTNCTIEASSIDVADFHEADSEAELAMAIER